MDEAPSPGPIDLTGAAAGEAIVLERVPGRYAIARLEASAAAPAWLPARAPLVAVMRTDSELAVVAPETSVPAEVQAERDFVAFRVRGPLAFDAVGILARLANALAAAGVPIMALSTFDTDYLLVRRAHEARAIDALGGVARLESA